MDVKNQRQRRRRQKKLNQKWLFKVIVWLGQLVASIAARLWFFDQE